MRKRLWLGGAAALALGGVLLWWNAASTPESPARASAAPGDVPSDGRARVVAQAQVVPIDGIIEVRPLAEGKVLRVLVQPGDRVEANQLLAEIESDMQSAGVQ